MNAFGGNAEQRADILRALTSVAVGLNRTSEVDEWFGALTQTRLANEWGWMLHAQCLDAAQRHADSGTACQPAASLDRSFWSAWCAAASSFVSAGQGYQDLALSDLRECISQGTGQSGSDTTTASGQAAIVAILHDRGVYEEA